MKKIMLLSLITVFITVSCGQKNKEATATSSGKTEKATELYACPMHPEVTGASGGECSECGMELTEKVVQTIPTEKELTLVETKVKSGAVLKTESADKTTFPTDAIVSNYLKIKNALTKDDSKGAAIAAKDLHAILNSSSATSLDTKLKNKYNAFVVDAKVNVKHIGDNAGKMEHQRTYFSLLSKDVFDLIKAFGTKQTVYQDYCPMYGAGKNGYWISETQDVINPYFGAEMLNCGRRIGAVQ
ncbi:DUF3347 domain-containing protein [Flavobacterium sp. RSP15]|uniref:DUF3347 domain-containing protein n=1 Tax=Flavobacterium sp. RSP15 TaxID=2497485 RepID=UPI000F82E434|nr:DUF3347 domain-containing protein [Flavobacterium sp. RSP15]RTY86970.1 DUF3347 domain-containing protein [Flavobacterium sp. RSP15]